MDFSYIEPGIKYLLLVPENYGKVDGVEVILSCVYLSYGTGYN